MYLQGMYADTYIGVCVCDCSGPADAKGLLLASIRCPDPVIFFEPKILYRSAVEEVPVGDYEVELGKAKVVKEGSHVTLIGWGNQVNVLAKVSIACLIDPHASLLCTPCPPLPAQPALLPAVSHSPTR